MSKDPALLFYTSDFLTGTMLLSHEQVGIYIRLICILHQHGGSIDLASFEAFIGIHSTLREKFIIEDGHVMHRRLNEEMEKRTKKSTNMSENAKVRWNKCKSNAKALNLHDGLHMLIEDVNANANEGTNTTKHINTSKDSKPKKVVIYVRDNPPTVEEINTYCWERRNGIVAQDFYDKNLSIGWIDKHGNPYKDWKAVIRLWESWNKATKPVVAQSGPSKRPINIVVVEKIAAGKTNHEILHELVGNYTEHDINESLMTVRGSKV